MKPILVSTLFLLVIAALGCGNPDQLAENVDRRTDEELADDSREADKAENAEPGAASLEELKQGFVTHCRNNDVEAALTLFYLEGANQRILDLYARSIPTAESGPPIATVAFEDVAEDDSNAANHTLEPIRKLLIGFGEQQSDGPTQVSQFFYIGTHQNRYYLVVPKG